MKQRFILDFTWLLGVLWVIIIWTGDGYSWNTSGTDWAGDDTTMSLNLGSSTWNDSAEDALYRWNVVSCSSFDFYFNNDNKDRCDRGTACIGTDGNAVEWEDFSNGVCSDAASGALAITRTNWLINYCNADVLFNTQYSWTTSSRNYTTGSPYNFNSVAIHEFGHVLGLQHENDNVATMNSIYHANDHKIHANDKGGLRNIYSVGGCSKVDVAPTNWKKTTSAAVAATLVSSPTSANTGQTINMEWTQENHGTQSTTFDIGFYLSTNSTITTSDTRLGINNNASLSREWVLTGSRNVTIPANTREGTYWLGVYLDYNNNVAESNEGNNALAHPRSIFIRDTIKPSPDPMSWSSYPYETSTTSIAMTAVLATDATSPVEYYHDYYSSTTGGAGGTDSGWQTSRSYTDSGLQANHRYSYRVRIRDSAATRNYSGYSIVSYDYTAIQTPTGITFGSYGTTNINAISTNTPSGLTRGSSGLIIYNSIQGTNSGWKQNNNYWNSTGLTPNTNYAFRARARNGDAALTSYSSYYYRRTLAAMPGAQAFSNITCTSIRANWSANGNPAGTQYYCQNTTTGAYSGWITDTFWTNNGLNDQSLYTYRVLARNANGLQTGWRGLGSQTTADCTPPNPNPMTWATLPYELNTSQIRMRSTTASDSTVPVRYYFDFFTSPTGGFGGSNSGWITSTTYTDSGLGTNHEYGYRVSAMDGSGWQTGYSAISYDFTDIETPSGIDFGTIGATSIAVRSSSKLSGLDRKSSGISIVNKTAGTKSDWQQNNNYWTNIGLKVNTAYTFYAVARNGDGNSTPESPESSRYTLANTPGATAFSDITATSIRANWGGNGNPAGTMYYCQNITAGTASDWISNTYWNSTGLDPETTYVLRVIARNGNGIGTAWTNLGSETTLPTVEPCEGDFDNNGMVDDVDLMAFAASFGRSDCSVAFPCNGDLESADGDVDGSDMITFLEDLGRTDCP
ncbi:MAG: hypothetical protein DRH34_02020 [Deltaproteobacteria bacterium]|nr:MAG: hypothetical protein DRH34_02020 [Deltaproteobacteria bacterium]